MRTQVEKANAFRALREREGAFIIPNPWDVGTAGSALSLSALGAFLRAAREMRETGTFAFAADAVSYAEISALLTNE
jgi:2-methylisocitrate lyase-like PEP mutase family enzyme